MRILMALLLLLCFGCKEDSKETSEKKESKMKFDKVKWMVKDDDSGYRYRDEMLEDLVYNIKLKGFRKTQVITLLNQPDWADKNYLFYTISHLKVGFFIFQARTLVIKLTKDNIVEWRKIKE